jgi:hypothetical protein
MTVRSTARRPIAREFLHAIVNFSAPPDASRAGRAAVDAAGHTECTT